MKLTKNLRGNMVESEGYTMGLHTITDENGKKLAEWYLVEPPNSFIVQFFTFDLVKCRQITTMIIKELGG